MLKSSFTSGFRENIESTSERFKDLSVSLDAKGLKQKHITQQQSQQYHAPTLTKRIPKSSSTLINTGNVCSRCRKETVPGFLQNCHEPNSFAEKEVEVKKEKSYKRKVYFNSCQNEKNVKELEPAPKSEECSETYNQQDEGNLPNLDPAAAPEFQSVFFNRRSSIVGNNEFWLPQCTFPQHTGEDENGDKVIPVTEEGEKKNRDTQNDPSCSQVISANQNKTEFGTVEDELAEFFNNIFRQTIKRQAKILHVASMLGNALVTLTDEYMFECRQDGNSFEIVNAIPLRDVKMIMVNDTCTTLVLQVCRASTLLECKEFVPGFPEKTESLISLMVFALSRVNGSLPDVIRLPLLSLPNYIPVQSWLLEQEEELGYIGIATAKHISISDRDFSEESFMMKIQPQTQFHPVSLLLRYGQIITKCNGGCNPDTCKHSIQLELKDCVVTRGDHPWPNSVRLKESSDKDITLACSTKESTNELVEKLYCCMQASNNASYVECLVCVVVTEYSLQVFQMTNNKASLFGSPLLNLNISNDDNNELSCYIETEGIEAGDAEILQLHHRWQLEFLTSEEKSKFMEVSTFYISE